MSYAADTSIIRWYQPGLCVLYTGSASRGNHFHLVNTGSGDIYTFEVNEEVTDMEILDDTLYYCGNVSGYYPALYYFPLMQLYSSNVVVRGIRHSPIMPYNPRKLEVFRATGGVHAVVVGDIEGMNRTDGFIADYWKSASSLFFTTDKLLYTADKECYDDVAVTDNYVVATGHVCNTGEIVLRVLDRPTVVCPFFPCTTNYSIFYNCSSSNTCEYTTYSYYGTDMKKPGGHGVYRVGITHTTGDHVVIACMVEDHGLTGITAKSIKIGSGGVPYVVKNICAWPKNTVGAYFNLRDIRYDAYSDSVLMLIDLLHPTGDISGIARLDNAGFSSLYLSYPSIPVEFSSIHSIDVGGRWGLPMGYEVHGKISSGTKGIMENGNTGIWGDALSVDACSNTDTLSFKESSGQMAQMRLPAYLDIRFNRYTDILTRPVTHSYIGIECGYQRNNGNMDN